MFVRCENCFEVYDSVSERCAHCGHLQGSPAKEVYHLYPGMVLNDRYRVGQVLGFGGFGITYKVWDARLNIVVAIKEYYPSGFVNRIPGTMEVSLFAKNRQREFSHGLERFLDEARNMAKFSSHQNIINVFEYFEENSTAYIVMEFLDGITLSEYMKSNRFDISTAVAVIRHVCVALRDIHRAGIVHRDVSPDNIFICSSGVVKLIDFGAARFSSDIEDRLMTIILKPGFAPPEQYEKVNAQGPWTDIYALGATFYFMVTGIKPDESTNRKIEDVIASPRDINHNVPENISNTIMKAMAIDKHLRFVSVEEFDRALVGIRKVTTVAKEKRRKKNRRLITVLASALVIAAAAAGFLWRFNMQREAETLPDVTLTVWYPLSAAGAAGDERVSGGGANADAAKNTAYAAIFEEFRTSFPNVTIELTTYPMSDYARELSEAFSAGEGPVLFESADVDTDDFSDSLESVRDVPGAAGLDRYYFFDNYREWFPDGDRLPLGFIAPVIYVNTTLTTDTAEYSMVLDERLTAARNEYQDAARNASQDASQQAASAVSPPEGVSVTARELFFSGRAARYFSDTSEFFDVQAALPARYALTQADSVSDVPVAARFSDVWSVGRHGENERRAAMRLLQFLLSDNAQDLLHVRNRSGALPINKAALDVFCEVHDEFDGIFSNIDEYIFNTR